MASEFSTHGDHRPRRDCGAVCVYGWCHHCGTCMPASRWIVREPDGLNECPECGDLHPGPMCLCDVTGDFFASTLAAAAGSHPDVPA